LPLEAAADPERPPTFIRGDGPPRAGGADLKGRGFWLRDFRLKDGRVEVFDTGADLTLDRTLIGECLVWFGYHMIVRARSWWLAATRRSRPRLWFTPHNPRPWYLVWAAAAWAGIRIVAAPEQADAAFAFEDATWTAALIPPLLPAFNFRCLDISKSHVAEVFEEVFGYPLAVDPTRWTGVAVEKGEGNGAHDGRLVHCPTAREPGRHYQRLIDTQEGGVVRDLRTACVGRRPVVVWTKSKAARDRFSIHNLSVRLDLPEQVFSPQELEQIVRFLSAMHLDWAGLDILRDRTDGRIYIVDVNTTDVGPIIALSLVDKLRSTALLADALKAMTPAPRLGR